MADFNFYLNRQGVRGNKGEQGEQGFSPYISVNTNTANEYTLDVTNESGTFTTPNLRGNAIEDEGGTYIRYNPETQGMYTGYADTASTTQQGEVTLSTPENLAAGGDGTVPTSGDVFDFVENKISEASVNYVDIEDYTQKMAELDGEINTLDTDKLDFSDLAGALKAGTNITITPNSTTGKITISGEPVDQAQADWDEADTTEPSYIKNKPTIPAAQIQSDWEQADSTALDYIKNKPVIDDELSSTSTNAVQNRLVTNAINLISNNMENLANKDLSNLTSAGDSRLHALKCYEDAGEILTDKEGLADVIKYAHSTYDNAKFTSLIHGTPTITSDGVASGFSSSNLLTISTSGIDWTKPYRIKVICNFANLTNSNQTLTVNNMPIIRLHDGKLEFSPATSFSQTSSVGAIVDTVNPTLNVDYIIEAEFSGTNYAFRKSIDGGETFTVIGTKTTSEIVTDLTSGGTSTLGGYPGDNYRAFSGSIDLKYFEIESNGIPVFSGNKTGIDIIKPDDYTVVGTPIISADGVASGFSSSDYIKTNTSIPIDKNFIFEIAGHIDELPAGDIIGGTYNPDNDVVPIIFEIGSANYSQKLTLTVNDNGTNSPISFVFGTPVYEAGDNFKVEVYRNKKTNTYGANFYRNGFLIKKFTQTSSLDLVLASNIILGAFKTNYTRNPFKGSIDLNAFKIYVDGSLAYQPCLKIPYTESKTGSKIVNATYRDRVNDMAKQFGSALYYTLSDTDFTLPQGELYGMIENATTAIPSGVVQSTSITNIVSLTQAEYDLIVPESDTLYIITPSS